MATLADARPTTAPIARGSAGATVRLHPIVTGTVAVPPNFFHRSGTSPLARLRDLGIGVPRRRWDRIPVVAYLLEHPTVGPLVIDTGLHPSIAVDPKQNLGRIGSLVLRDIEFEPSESLPAQIRARGVDPGQVRFVLMTHLHFDHASAISEFEGAIVVATAAEWAAATATAGTFNGYVHRQLDHAIDYRLLDFDSAGTDSFATFGRAIDLFGDGSVHALSTPGHTAGHMSFVCRLSDREALACGDAIYEIASLEQLRLPAIMEDEHTYRRSVREIQLYARGTPGAVVIPGHDLEYMQTLDSVYA